MKAHYSEQFEDKLNPHLQSTIDSDSLRWSYKNDQLRKRRQSEVKGIASKRCDMKDQLLWEISRSELKGISEGDDRKTFDADIMFKQKVVEQE